MDVAAREQYQRTGVERQSLLEVIPFSCRQRTSKGDSEMDPRGPIGDYFRLATTRELEEFYLPFAVRQEQMPCSLAPNCISRELWLPRIAVVRSRPPRFHWHRKVAVPKPSEPPADSRCELRRKTLEKN
jgi:hypothetical protein